MRKVIYLSLILFCVVFASCSSKAPGAAAKKYMEYVKDGDFEQFADGIMYQEDATQEDIEQSKAMITSLLKEKAVKEIEKKGGIDKIEIVSETVAQDGKTADVVLRMIYGNGSSEESNCKMVLDQGIWKMNIKK